MSYSPGSMNPQDHRSPFRRSPGPLWLLAGGVLLLALEGGGLLPMAALLGALSPQGSLSPPLVELLRQSQWWLGISLAAGAVLSALAVHPRCVLAAPAAALTRSPWLLPLLAAAGMAGALAVQHVLLDGIPHVTDASSHWFQARIFRAGRAAVPVPPCPEAFFQHGVVMGDTGLWHSKYYPGTALGLAVLGRAFVPLSFGLLLWAFHFIAGRYLPRPVALLSTAALAWSPMMLLLAGSFMSHVPLLMWMSLAWAGALKAVESGRGRFAAGAGFAAGLGVLTRPLDGALLGVLIGAAILADDRFAPRRKAQAFGWSLAGVAIPAIGMLILNRFLYGTPWTTGYNFSHSSAHYGIRVGLSESFPLSTALLQGGWVLAKLNQALLGWPTSFLFAAWALLFSARRRQAWLVAVTALVLYLPYFFYFYYGFEYEARYTFSTVPFLCILTGMGLHAAWQSPWRRLLPGLVLAFVLYAAAYYWPAYLWPRYAGAYEESSPAIHQAAEQAGLDLPALVLLPDKGFVYTSGFIYNDPLLRNPILYARDIPGRISCLQAAFPGRHPYRYRPAADDPFRGRFERIAVAPAEAPARPPTRSYSAANASSPRSGE